MVWLMGARRVKVGDVETGACLSEANELISIFVASIATAERNDRRTS